MAEHYWPDDIKIPGSTAPTVTLQGGAPVPASVILGTRLTLTANTSVTWTTTDSSVLDLTVPSQTRATKSVEGTEAVAVAVGTGNAEIQVRDADGNTSTYPIAVAQNATQQDVFLTVGEERTFEVGTAEAKDYITGNDAYIATAKVTEGKAQSASFNQVTSITSGKKYLITNGSSHVVTNTSTTTSNFDGPATGLEIKNLDVTSTDNTAELSNYLWTITKSGTGYTVVDVKGKYLSINSNSSVTLSDSETVLNATSYGGKVAFHNGNSVYLDNFGGSTHPYFNTLASAWYTTSPADNNKWTLYEAVEASSGNNTLTITGVGESTTDVTVGNVTYNIHVTAPSKTDSTTLSHGGSFTLPNGAADVKVTSGTEYVAVNGATITAGNTDGTATITYTVKNNGGYVTARYTHTVTVSAIDFDNIEPLHVQLWITNTWVGADSAPTSLQTVNIPAENAYSEAGVPLSQFVPSTGYKRMAVMLGSYTGRASPCTTV